MHLSLEHARESCHRRRRRHHRGRRPSSLFETNAVGNIMLHRPRFARPSCAKNCKSSRRRSQPKRMREVFATQRLGFGLHLLWRGEFRGSAHRDRSPLTPGQVLLCSCATRGCSWLCARFDQAESLLLSCHVGFYTSAAAGGECKQLPLSVILRAQLRSFRVVKLSLLVGRWERLGARDSGGGLRKVLLEVCFHQWMLDRNSRFMISSSATPIW